MKVLLSFMSCALCLYSYDAKSGVASHYITSVQCIKYINILCQPPRHVSCNRKNIFGLYILQYAAVYCQSKLLKNVGPRRNLEVDIVAEKKNNSKINVERWLYIRILYAETNVGIVTK